jgi:hypothetical protein
MASDNLLCLFVAGMLKRFEKKMTRGNSLVRWRCPEHRRHSPPSKKKTGFILPRWKHRVLRGENECLVWLRCLIFSN